MEEKGAGFCSGNADFYRHFFENSVMTQAENKEENRKITSKYIICYDGQEETFSNFMVKSCKIWRMAQFVL